MPRGLPSASITSLLRYYDLSDYLTIILASSLLHLLANTQNSGKLGAPRRYARGLPASGEAYSFVNVDGPWQEKKKVTPPSMPARSKPRAECSV